MRFREARWATVALAAVALAAPAAALAASPPDAIRVPGLSAPSDFRLAVVGSKRKLTGKPFRVLGDGGVVVARGKLQRLQGSASPWKHAAGANVTAPSDPGTYQLRVGKLTSPPWFVDPAATSQLITRAEAVFNINADGLERNTVFGPSHLNDAAAPIVGGPTNGGTIDVSGGWRDAGDAIKFTVTTAMSSVMLDYAAQLEPADAAQLTSLSDIGVHWLEKAHPAGSSTFIAQVADDSDHNGGFRDFATDDAASDPAFSHRKAYGDAGSGILGSGAAALASAAIRSGTATARGQALLALAKQWYDRGKAVSGSGPALGGFPQPGGDGFSDWQGFMALAAAELFHAGAGDGAGDPYLTDSIGFLNAAKPEAGFAPYYSVSGLAAADLCGGLATPAVPREDVRSVACGRLQVAVDGAAFRAGLNAFASPGGFYFGWIQDHAGGGALMAAAERAGIFPGGIALAARARDYLLGDNPWGASFFVGSAKREAHQPHHSIFLKGDPSTIGNGLLVGGPSVASQFGDFGIKPQRTGPYARFNPTYHDDQYNDKIVYEDRQADFVTSEVGLAYSASAILLFASL